MPPSKLKKIFTEIIEEHQSFDLYELRRIFYEATQEWEMKQGWSQDQKGESWSDDELRTVLSDAPTKENCLKHARAFKRGYGSIEQIYRWAATTDTHIKYARPDDAFIAQVKRISKQLGWRA